MTDDEQVRQAAAILGRRSKGVPRGETSRQNGRKMQGQRLSEETKAKMAAAQRARREREREMQTITITNEFHGTSINIRVRPDNTISDATYRRARRALCPSTASAKGPDLPCKCFGSGAAPGTRILAQAWPKGDDWVMGETD